MADPAIAALNSLLRRSEVEDHTEALRLANAAIKAASRPGGESLVTAQHTKVVALLKLDRFDDALRAIADGGSKLEEQCVLEKAYALYKTGELDAAESVLQKSDNTSDRALKHIAAQVAYRAEKFDYAAELYRDLAREEGGNYGEENDLKINLLATHAQLEWQGKGDIVPEKSKQPGREDLEAFEPAYNAACGCLARGDFAKASILLKRARDLCEALEDLSDEEKKTELLPILIQQAYTSTRLGKLDEAAELTKAVKASDISDRSTNKVAHSNSLALKADGNPYLIQRLAENLPEVTGNDRLFEYQAAVLQRNKYIIELQAQKFQGVQNRTAQLLKKDATPSVSLERVNLGVLNAAATTHLEGGKEALRKILPLLDTRPDDIGLLLTIIQLYIQTKNPIPALSLLEAFFKRLEAASTRDHDDVRYAPGLVALAVALYRLQGRQGAIHRELAKAAAHWETDAKNPPISLLKEAGIELLRSSNPSDLATAGAAFERLVSISPDDKAADAGLIASFATSNYSKVEPFLSNLTPIDKLTSNTDVQSLIDHGVASLPTLLPAQAKKRAIDASEAEKAAAAAGPQKKRRKRRLPKNYEEGKKPDPERWLPLRDRSTYRPKGKKGKKRVAEATQGGLPVKEEGETLELVGGAGAVKVEKAPAGGNKKKKKGKK